MQRLTYVYLIVIYSCTNSSVPLSDQSILFLGDSITQNGEYVSIISYYLQKEFPKANFDLLSIGLSSETLSCLTENDHPFPRPCLEERLDRALEKTKPQLIFACYGMNDGIYHPYDSSRFEAFQDGVILLKNKASAISAKLVLLSPPPFDSLPIQDKLAPLSASDFSYRAPFAAYDEVLEHYATWLMSQSSDSVMIINVHKALNQFIKEKRLSTPEFTLAKDGIHPSNLGHLVIAQTVLKHYNIQIPKNLEGELQRLQEDELYEVIATKRKVDSEAWLPYVGFIRGDTVQQTSIQQAIEKSNRLQEQINSLRLKK